MADSPRTKRLINRIYEAFADVGQPGSSVNEEALRLRAEIAFNALRAEERVYPPEEDCPHAAPFRFCPKCVVSPCPIGLDKMAESASTVEREK